MIWPILSPRSGQVEWQRLMSSRQTGCIPAPRPPSEKRVPLHSGKLLLSLANLSPAGVFPQMAAKKTELPLKLTQLSCLWFRDSRCWSTPQKPQGDGAQVCDTEGAHPHSPHPPSYFLCSRHRHRPPIHLAFPAHGPTPSPPPSIVPHSSPAFSSDVTVPCT